MVALAPERPPERRFYESGPVGADGFGIPLFSFPACARRRVGFRQKEGYRGKEFSSLAVIGLRGAFFVCAALWRVAYE